MEIPRHWRMREFRLRMAVKSGSALLENNPYVGISHALSSEKLIEKVHENRLSGEIEIAKLLEENEGAV